MPPIKKSSKTKENDNSEEDVRMWSALIFVVILFVIGLPLWWHLTTVERADLPYSKIERLNHTHVYLNTNIFIVTKDKSRTTQLINELNTLLNQKEFDIIKYNILEKEIKEDVQFIPEELEKNSKIHPKEPGVYQLVLCPGLNSSKVLFGSHRTLYFSESIDAAQLAKVIKFNLIQEDVLVQAKEAITTPGYVIKPGDKETPRRVRLSSHFDLIFTFIVPDPEEIKAEWDFPTVTAAYIQPLLDQLSLMSNYSIKSQWLYHVDLEQKPQKTEEGYSISQKQTSHIVSSLENKLGSYASKNPCLHFVIYTTECKFVPMFFVSENIKSQTIISNRWGSIQIVNPNQESNCKSKEVFTPDPHPIMAVFVNDLKQLLGVKQAISMTDVEVVPHNEALLTDWEIDALYRIRTVEQFASSRLTLNSLVQLLGQIGNIVINSQVGDAVYKAVENAEKTEQVFEAGNLESAMLYSREAFNSSEFAFTHPTLLALLYFPDDQKYAVYIPLFLPVMIPVVISLSTIFKWVKKKLPADLLQHIQLPCIPDQTQLYDDDKTE